MSNSQTSFAHSNDRTPELSQLTFMKIAAFYGDAQVLNDVSLSIKPGEIVALLGSNGAGKTTLLRTLTGLLRIRRGRIILDNESIDGLPAYKIIRMGVASVPEGLECCR